MPREGSSNSQNLPQFQPHVGERWLPPLFQPGRAETVSELGGRSYYVLQDYRSAA